MGIANNNGYVGIGIESPLSPLHVHSIIKIGVTKIPTYYGFWLTNPYTGTTENDGFSIYQYGNEINMLQRENANLNIGGIGGGITISPSGYLGIGTSTPCQRLHIAGGNIIISKGTTQAPGSANGSIYFGQDVTASCPYGEWGIEYYGQGGTENENGLNLWKTWSCTSGGFNYGLFLSNTGNVGIGTGNPQFKLAVNGTIGSKEVMVTIQSSYWPDYVFESDYELRPLVEVENFININKHLPDVPSATEVEDNGVKLGEMNAILLKKVEELTLYMIEQSKKIEALQIEVNNLK